MPGESFRFIHASDFHLETPLGDLDTLPPHLKEALVSAPRDAARAVFDAALVDNIDFLVLSGDLLSPMAAGPHGMSLLLDGFERLYAKQTPVFWAAGLADDPQNWPEAVPLPPNVTLFPQDRAIAVPVQRAGRTICRVVGRSSEGRSGHHVKSYGAEASDEFTVAMGYGNAEAELLAEGRFDYWALGGEHNPREIDGAASGGAAYSGSPQGRSLSETGPHGYTIVDVDADANVRAHPVQCDQFRFCHVTIDAAEIAPTGNLRNLLGERLIRLQHEQGGRHLLIAWEIKAGQAEMLHSIGDSEELLGWLRREFGHGTPAAWSLRVTVRPPNHYPNSWQDEDTILGDYLRAADTLRKEGGLSVDLLPFTEEHSFGEPEGLPTTAANTLADIPASEKAETLAQATLLGVELLRGGKHPRGNRS